MEPTCLESRTLAWTREVQGQFALHGSPSDNVSMGVSPDTGRLARHVPHRSGYSCLVGWWQGWRAMWRRVSKSTAGLVHSVISMLVAVADAARRGRLLRLPVKGSPWGGGGGKKGERKKKKRKEKAANLRSWKRRRS